MRKLIAWTGTLVAGALIQGEGVAQVAAPSATKKAAAPASKPTQGVVDPAIEKTRLDAEQAKARQAMDRVLAEWEVKSKQIKSLDVVFDRVDRSVGWGDQYYQGRAMLQSPDQACLQFQKNKLDPDGKPLVSVDKSGRKVAQLEAEPYERIVCTGTEVLQYSWDDRKMFIFPLDDESRQKALQQGPLPFLFNMKAADARRRYSMSLLKEDDKEYLIGIDPREEIDKKSFSRAFLWLSKTTYLPNQLWLYTVGEKERQEFRFAGGSNTIVANRPLDQSFFKPKQYEGWKVIRNPGAEGAEPAPGDPARAARRPAAQPPTRPATRPR